MEGNAGTKSKWTLYLGGSALLLFVALLALRTFIIRPYQVTTSSMEPTIHGDGERVLVQFGGTSGLQRYDLVVIDRGEGGPPLVKRIGGLPGERFQLSGGDVMIGGDPAGHEGEFAPRVTLFDSALASISDAFDFRAAKEGGPTSDYPWLVGKSAAGAEVTLEAFDLAPGREYGMMRHSEELRDSYLDGAGALVQGAHEVNDIAVSFDFRVRRAARNGRIRARLVEEADSFEAVLEINQDQSGYSLRIERTPGDVLAASVLDFGGLGQALPTSSDLESPPWLRLTFINCDNRLLAKVQALSGELLAQVAVNYDANLPYLGVGVQGAAGPHRSVASRVALGGEAVTADIRAIEISRDLFWIPVGDFGVKAPFVLGPDEYFILGDNSAKSADSRLWGPIRGASILGRPTRIVWPMDRLRALR